MAMGLGGPQICFVGPRTKRRDVGVGQAGLHPSQGLRGPCRNSEPVAYRVPSSMTWTRCPTRLWGRGEASRQPTWSTRRLQPKVASQAAALPPRQDLEPVTVPVACGSPPLSRRAEGRVTPAQLGHVPERHHEPGRLPLLFKASIFASNLVLE